MTSTHRSVCVLNPDSHQTPRETNHTKHQNTSTVKPEQSDFFPSVSLAAILVLVFIFVLPMLFPSGPVKTLVGVKEKTGYFHPLLYGQPLSTHLIVDRLKKNGEEATTLLAVAEEGAMKTLVCFSTNVISLLSKHGQVQSATKRVSEYRPQAADLNDRVLRLPKLFSVAVIIQRRGRTPHCVILGPPNPLNGQLHLMEISLPGSASETKVALRNESSIMAEELLQHLYKTAHVPETFESKESGQHLRVIHIQGDPYLERGVVC